MKRNILELGLWAHFRIMETVPRCCLDGRHAVLETIQPEWDAVGNSFDAKKAVCFSESSLGKEIQDCLHNCRQYVRIALIKRESQS